MLTLESTEFATRIAVFSKPDDVPKLARLLVDELGLHPTDAMHEARSVPCILTPRLTSANARRMSAAIERLGLRTEPIHLDELWAFEDLHSVHQVACRPSGLEILDLLSHPAELIPWSDLEVLYVGETPAVVSHHQLSGSFSVISASGHLPDVSIDVLGHTPELWIVCRHSQRVYRLDASRMNFESLAEHMTNSMRINLRRLLRDIVSHAPNS